MKLGCVVGYNQYTYLSDDYEYGVQVYLQLCKGVCLWSGIIAQKCASVSDSLLEIYNHFDDAIILWIYVD